MREISVDEIQRTVRDLIIEACCVIGEDVMAALRRAEEAEESPLGRHVLHQLIENHELAARERIPVCQDTGMAVVFLDVGQDVHVVGGDLREAVDRGVAQAYVEGYLRKSVVRDPLFDRTNTGDNAPAVIFCDIVPGDRLGISVCPKGFGSENKSAVRMLTPAQGARGVVQFVSETVIDAGPDPCPPIVVGVGVGGTMEKAAIMAKRALLRPLGRPHDDPRWAALEEEILERIDASGVGPAGMGGRSTALAVHVERSATHIAGLPVAVNVCCHALRHATATL